MSNFYNKYIKVKYGDKAKFLFTYTDSFYYMIEIENVYEDFHKDKELFDSSKRLKYYDNTNNLVVGKMKDKLCGVPMKSFVGLE